MNVLIDTAIFSLQQHGGVSRLWRSLLPALRDAMPDAAFTASQPPEWFASTYYQRAPIGVRSLVVVYDMICEKYPLIDTNRADAVDKRRAIAEASAVVSISQQTAADVKRFTGRDSVVAYPGVDAAFGHVKPSDVERFQAWIGKPYLLMVGNRGLYKNAQAVYQAWGLWAMRQGYKLLCVGGEDTLPQDVAFARRYPDAWQRAALSDADMPAAYAGAAALVYPSLMEGFGLPIVEAMACACPVICDHAMREVGGGAVMAYCDMTRPREIAEALMSVGDYGIRLHCGVQGVEWAKRYTWPGMARTVADVLRRAA